MCVCVYAYANVIHNVSPSLEFFLLLHFIYSIECEYFIFVRTMFQVRINPGAPIQIVQNGITIRHPALPPVPESPPQPLPPVNPDALATSNLQFPISTQFFGNSAQQQLSNAIRPTSIFVGGRYHKLFKRERNGRPRELNVNNTVTSSLAQNKESIVKREIVKISETGHSNNKVSEYNPESL